MAVQEEGGLWRPANATEAQDFEHQWCRHCLNRNGDGNWEDEFGNEIDGACIVQDQMYWSAEFQPPELIIRHGQPWCTAFRQDTDVPSRCLFTKEMDA
jgi:hypothetical protein